jgi:L-alanine-DL-glutamate epimerase-like enolase superfamily enzyme
VTGQGQGQHATARPDDQVRTASRPSELRITDMRTATVGWNNWHFTIVRIDTNQGNQRLRRGARLRQQELCADAEEPPPRRESLQCGQTLRKIKQFGGHGRQGGGVCGVEMALMDLAGKAYGVPAYVLAGGKFRDRVRMYCDTPNELTGEAMGKKLQERIDRGYTWLKMDVGCNR